MKIAVLNFRDISHPKHGGAEVFLEKLGQEWTESGHEVVFFSPKSNQRYLDLRNEHIKYLQVGNQFTAYNKIPKTVLKENWDLIIDCFNVRGFELQRWKKSFSNPSKSVVLIFQTAEEVWREMTPFPLSYIGRKILEPYWLKKYIGYEIITICQSNVKALEKFGLNTFKVIEPGFEIDVKHAPALKYNFSSTKSVINIVFCARLVAMKRPFDAIDVVKCLVDEKNVREFVLHVIGDGPLLEKLKRYANSRKVNVVFHGRISDASRNDVYKKSDFVIGTSVREGWGLTISEGAYYGCIPIVYDVAGLRDSSKKAAGFNVPERPEYIAKKIIELLTSVNLEKKVIGNGLESWRETSEKFIEGFDSGAI